ncbi:hypothetical protein IW261DRAFT_1422814 [Armillaria novae-zelandiae]|uniref:Uncharacterized protein n=1 Tax=Armillaria novae-zelandiae TaxID=153914 RepID=A0AA39T9R3_9AGAR|nr:hypothetical protein IW261DRAFT_1422814 [Armillaria novae-zelandiae]
MPHPQSDPEKIPNMMLPDPPDDYISTLACSNGTGLLAAGSWDKTDGKKLFSGGMDGVGFLSDASTGQVVQSTCHDTAIQMANWLEFSNGSSALLTMEWDKTMKASQFYRLMSQALMYWH